MARSKATVEVEVKGESSSAQRAAKDTRNSFKQLEDSAKHLSSAFHDALSGKLGSAFTDAKAGFKDLGAAAGGSGALIGVGIAAGAATAGAALGKFALDGAAKFEDLALHVSAFSKATGLSTIEASKFIEVAKDLKIDPSTFEGAFVKMEKGIATNRAAFGDLVVTAKDGSTDLTATFLRVVRHLQAIKDPIERANESAKLFGRGFAGISEIIGTSADELSSRLEAVSKQSGKIITPDEVKQAQAYRDALDNFHDAVENASISLGQALVPSLAEAARGAGFLVDALDRAAGALGPKLKQAFLQGGLGNIGAIVDHFKGAKKATEDFATAAQVAFQGQLTTKADLYAQTIAKAGAASDASAQAADRLMAANNRYADSAGAMAGQARIAAAALQTETDKVNAQKSAIDSLLGSTTSVDRAQQDFIDKSKAVGEAQIAAAKGGKDHADKLRTLRLAIDDAKDSAQALGQANIKQAQDQAKATGKTLTAQQENKILSDTYRTLAGTQKGPVADALRGTALLLDTVGKKHPTPTVSVNDKATAKAAAIKANMEAIDRISVSATANLTGDALSKLQNLIRLGQSFAGHSYVADATLITHNVARAAGGPVAAGHTYLIGERGPELFTAPRNGVIIPNSQIGGSGIGGGGVGGNTYNIQVSVAPTADLGSIGQQVVGAIKAYEKRVGAGWRA